MAYNFWELAPPGYRLISDIEKKKRKLLLPGIEDDFPPPDFAAEEQAGLTALAERTPFGAQAIQTTPFGSRIQTQEPETTWEQEQAEAAAMRQPVRLSPFAVQPGLREYGEFPVRTAIKQIPQGLATGFMRGLAKTGLPVPESLKERARRYAESRQPEGIAGELAAGVAEQAAIPVFTREEQESPLMALGMMPAGGVTRGFGQAAVEAARASRVVLPGAVAKGAEVAGKAITADQRGILPIGSKELGISKFTGKLSNLQPAYEKIKALAKENGFDLTAVESLTPGEYWVHLELPKKKGANRAWVEKFGEERFKELDELSQGNPPKVVKGYRQEGQYKSFLPFKSLEDAYKFLKEGDTSVITKEIKGTTVTGKVKPLTAQEEAAFERSSLKFGPTVEDLQSEVDKAKSSIDDWIAKFGDEPDSEYLDNKRTELFNAQQALERRKSIEAKQAAKPLPVQAQLGQAGKEAKQPWEMTKAEFDSLFNAPRSQEEIADRLVNQYRQHDPITGGEVWLTNTPQSAKDAYQRQLIQGKYSLRGETHKVVIEQALARGDSVPPEVLANYPDLAAKAKPLPVQAPLAQAGKEAKQPWEMTQDEFSIYRYPALQGGERLPQAVRVRQLLEANGIKIEAMEVRGSRALGVEVPTSDIDIFIKVPEAQFSKADDLITPLIKEKIDVLMNWEGVGKLGGVIRGEKTHRRLVERALTEGKSVPPEVLAEYPDLAAKAKPAETLAPKTAAETVAATTPELVPPTKVAQGEAEKLLKLTPDTENATNDIIIKHNYKLHYDFDFKELMGKTWNEVNAADNTMLWRPWLRESTDPLIKDLVKLANSKEGVDKALLYNEALTIERMNNPDLLNYNGPIYQTMVVNYNNHRPLRTPTPELVSPTKVAQGEAAITPPLQKAAAPQTGAGVETPVKPVAKYPLEVARQDAQSGIAPPSSDGVMPSSIPPRDPSTPPPPTLPGATITATTKERKFFLPEPPRILSRFLAFAKSQVKGSYRGKIGGVETIENARQVVLKARDMGEQTIGYVDSYIYSAGNVGKEFKLDPSGRVTNVLNPNNRSLAWNDVMSNYSHYQLTPKQKEIALRYGDVYAEGRRLAHSYGVEIGELPSPDIFWQYIARRVKGKLNPITLDYDIPQGAIGGFKMGAKISAQKKRILDQMIEGVDLGLLYENPQETMKAYIKGIYRLIGNKQAENLVKPLTRTLRPGAHIPFGLSEIHEPALQGRVIATDLARQIDKIFTPEQEYKALRIAADISGAGVSQIASLDISALFIQGLVILGHDLKQGLKGKPTFVWAKSAGNMFKAIKNPEYINKFRESRMDLYKRAIEAGVITGQSEFVSGVGTVQRLVGKIPKVGGGFAEGYRQAYGRMGQAYSDTLESARILMFEQLEPVWQRQGHDMFQLGAVVNRMSGTVSSAARGIGANRRLAERVAAFAPNYLRSSLLIMVDLVSRGAAAREVQSSIATLLGIGAVVYYAEETLRGEIPKMNPLPKRFGGDGAEAYTIRIGDTRTGFGSWMYGMIKTLAEIGAVAVDEPEALIKWNEKHPVVRFAKSKAGWGVSLASELATGKNFYGQDFTGPDDYLNRIIESVTPISSQSILTQKPKGEIQQVAAELAGMRSFPVSVAERQRDIAERQGLVQPGEPLPPKLKSQMELSTEGRAIIDESGRITSAQEARRERYDQGKMLDTRLQAFWSGTTPMQGAISPKEWRGQLHDMALEGIGSSKWRERMGEFEGRKFKPTDPEYTLAKYYEYSKLLYDAQLPRDLIAEELDNFMAVLTPEKSTIVKNNLHPNATPLQDAYYTDIVKLRPWFDMRNQFEKEFRNIGYKKVQEEMESAIRMGDKIAQANLRYLYLQSKKMESIQERKKELYLRDNAVMDELLIKWGYRTQASNLEVRIKQRNGILSQQFSQELAEAIR